MTEHAERPFKFVGGQLCLDFANTVGWPSGRESRDPLSEYDRFTRFGRVLDWGRQVGALGELEWSALRRRAEQRPAEAEAVLRRALSLRRAIHWLFVDTAARRRVDGEDLALLNAELRRALGRLQIVDREPRFAWGWSDEEGLDRVLWPVARSAADLLVSDQLPRVRPCAADPCGFLFLDTSPNGRRRWCIMEECGNRAKARRHYHRAHASQGAARGL